MTVEDLFDKAVSDVADGKSVDWEGLVARAGNADDRERLRWLRLLGVVGDLHRSTAGDGRARDDDDHDDDDASTGETERDDDAEGVGLATGADASGVRRWGQFHLLEEVGAGSYGRVYRGWDPQLQREVAVKILHRRFTGEGLTERLLHEGRALAKVRHPNVVSVHAVETHETRVGLCMEYVRGRTLDDIVITEGTFSIRDAVQVSQDVCRALSAVHRAGLVHRDVKARNVMREDNGRVVLMDFGTGQRASSGGTHARDLIGTPMYMAPEVLNGEEATPRSDVYSAGVLMFHLLTGVYPVQADTIDGLRARHREGRRQPLTALRPDAPPPLVRAIERALDPSPARRYAQASALCDAIDGVVRKQESREAIGLRFRRGARAAGFAAALALAIGCLTTVAFNHTLERGEFADETLSDWLIWGLRASVAPAFVFLMAWLIVGCGRIVRALAIRLSSSAARADDAFRRAVTRWAEKLALDDASVLASWVLLASVSTLLVAWWSFVPLIEAFTASASRATPQTLAPLAPASEAYQNSYRQTFSLLLFVWTAAWYGVWRLMSSRHQPLTPGLLAGGIAALGLTLASLDLPYRTLMHSRFEVADWNSHVCYILGSHEDERLLFCPGLPPPRNVRVSVRDPQLKPQGRRENIFTAFGHTTAFGNTDLEKGRP